MLSKETEEIVAMLQSGDLISAEKACAYAISGYKNEFMEKLTVNSATDYIGMTLLYAQIAAKMKKPWMAIPTLDSVRGALRFISDFMEDRETVAETYFSAADAYSYAGFLPEAIDLYRRAGLIGKDAQLKKEAFFQARYLSERFPKEKDETVKSAISVLGKREGEKICQLALDEAASAVATDPVENTEEYLAVRYDVEKLVDEVLSRDDSNESFCFRYWNTKKRILSEKFKIDWETPAEMNPNIRFQ